MARRRTTTRLREAKRRAQREGWAKWLRKGPGEEADERALLNGCWIDTWRGEHMCRFVETYGTLTEGAFAGQQFQLLDWQREQIMRLFGWVRHSTEWGYPVRRFKEFYCEIPKKNGKTPFASVLGLGLLVADSFNRQLNLFTAATTKKRAQDLNVHALRQITRNDALREVCQIKSADGYKEIWKGDSVWRVLPATEEGADGVNGSVIADEVHLWVGFVFYTALKWALASQPEGLFIGITTAGRDMESLCRHLHDKTKAINAGEQHDDQFLGVIYAADPDDDPHKEKVWRKANPSLGTTAAAPLKLSDFKADYQHAKDDPVLWPEWKQKRLNLWRTAESAWVEELGGIEIWDAGARARAATRKRIDCWEDFGLQELEGCVCDLGIDTASTLDTTAAVASILDESDGTVWLWPMFWLPERRAIELQEKVPYRSYAERGWLKLTPGDAVDFDVIYQDLIEFGERVTVRHMYFDPRWQGEYLTARLCSDLGAARFQFDQTNRNYTRAVDNFERLYVERKLRHPGNGLLTWQLGNARITTDTRGYRRPIKQKRGDVRTIDGVAAKLMSLWEIEERDQAASYYDENEVEFINPINC